MCSPLFRQRLTTFDQRQRLLITFPRYKPLFITNVVRRSIVPVLIIFKKITDFASFTKISSAGYACVEEIIYIQQTVLDQLNLKWVETTHRTKPYRGAVTRPEALWFPQRQE